MTSPDVIGKQQDKPVEAPEPEAPPRQGFYRRHPKLVWGLIIGIPLLLAGAIAVWWYYSGRETTDDARIDGHIIPISARVGGRVIYAPLEENTFVKAGTVLVKL